KADIRDELIHRDVVFQGNIAKAIFSKALTDLQDVEELLTQAEELANNPPPSRADAGLTDPSAPGADSGAGDQASAGDGGGGGGEGGGDQGSGGQGVQPAQVPFPEGPPDGGSLMQLASQNPITPGVDPSVSE